MLNLKYLLPDSYQDSIYQINYQGLAKQGIKALLFDLDNTLIDYVQTKLTVEVIEFLKELEKTFKIIIISNFHKKRVQNAIGTHFDLIYFAKKPLKFGFKKAIKNLGYKSHEIAMIGDQLMTDIYGGNRTDLFTIIVDPIQKKTDKLPTRINRKIENYFIKRVEKKYPKAYEEVL